MYIQYDNYACTHRFPISSPRYGTREEQCLCRNVYVCNSNNVLKTSVILYSNVYEPPSHLRDGGDIPW